MQVNLVRVYTGETGKTKVKDKDGKEKEITYQKSYYCLITQNGRKILIEGATDNSKALLNAFADVKKPEELPF